MKAAGNNLRLPADCLARKTMRYYFEERTNKIFRGRRRTTVVSTLNEEIQQTKGDDIAFPVTPFVSRVSLQNLYTKAKNRKLWSKIVQQVVKLTYSRWSRWSMPHSDRKKKRLSNVTVCFEAPKMYTNQLSNICNRVAMELQYLQLYQRYASLQVLFKIFAQIRFYCRLPSEKAVDAKGFEWKSNCTKMAKYTSDFKHKIYCNIYIAKPGQAVYFKFSIGVFRTLSNV